ncbi:MAG: hypothetical protein IJY39_12070 [Clostridia bacterium]|nr:hypothetical protein [Clostridia bacterium]
MEIILQPKSQNMTAEIQKAIDDCFLAGGGRIILEKGIYTAGGLRLRSNCTLYLRSGAILKGTREIEDYKILEGDRIEPVNEAYKTDVLWTPPRTRTTFDHITKAAGAWNNALIRILDAHDVAIIGEEGSVIDGSDPYDPKGEEYYRGPHGIAYHYSKNLKFEGYTIKNTGNWAHIGYKSQNIEYKNLEVLGGHDGIHNSSCDHFTIEDCGFYTGDDCIAGFDNFNVKISNCVINSACSGLRFGGTDVLIEKCRFFGPAKYFFRGSLSLEDKIAGNPCPKTGRTNMLALFTYYCDFTLDVRRMPGNIVIRDCTVENCDRFLHFDFTGTHTWQKNKPLTSVTFENIEAKGIAMPFNAYGDPENPLTLKLKNCGIAFSAPTDCAIRGGNFDLVSVESSVFENVDGALIKCFGKKGKIEAENVLGVKRICDETDEKFESKSI